jgi:hypothetical protein
LTQTLLICSGAADNHLNDLSDSTIGIAFMGTPHVGSNLAKWGNILNRFFNVLQKPNSEVVRVLKFAAMIGTT